MKKRGFIPFKYQRNLTGFTLIELLIVVAIIGILATVVILNVSGARAKSQDSKIKDDFSAIVKANEIAIADGGVPILSSGYDSLVNAVSASPPKDGDNKALMTTGPASPIAGKEYKYLGVDILTDMMYGYLKDDYPGRTYYYGMSALMATKGSGGTDKCYTCVLAVCSEKPQNDMTLPAGPSCLATSF